MPKVFRCDVVFRQWNPPSSWVDELRGETVETPGGTYVTIAEGGPLWPMDDRWKESPEAARQAAADHATNLAAQLTGVANTLREGQRP